MTFSQTILKENRTKYNHIIKILILLMYQIYIIWQPIPVMSQNWPTLDWGIKLLYSTHSKPLCSMNGRVLALYVECCGFKPWPGSDQDMKKGSFANHLALEIKVTGSFKRGFKKRCVKEPSLHISLIARQR